MKLPIVVDFCSIAHFARSMEWESVGGSEIEASLGTGTKWSMFS